MPDVIATMVGSRREEVVECCLFLLAERAESEAQEARDRRALGSGSLGGVMRRVGVATRRRGLIGAAAMVLGAALVTQVGPGQAGASTLPTGFRDSVVLSGMTNPTVLQFAADGRIFVGQKNGVIKVFQSLTDTNPVTFADLSGRVHDFWDRGLLGLALPPNFPVSPYVYVLYAYDAQSAARYRRGATPARHHLAPPPTAALSRRGCRDCRSAGTS
jgi:hypothetical protein